MTASSDGGSLTQGKHLGWGVGHVSKKKDAASSIKSNERAGSW